MTIVVLLILVIVWAAVLGPSLLRRRAERSTDSIGAFHRQLRVLQRTGPAVIDPAHTLQARGPFRLPRSTSGLPVVRPDAPQRPGRGRTDPYFRADACRRRRNILFGLLAASFLSGVLAVVAGPMLFVAVVSMVLLVGYVSLLVYLRTLAAERESKLRYLPHAVAADSAVAVRRVAAR